MHVGATPVAVTLNGRRRWGRKDDGAGAGSGPQRLVAPMPGKVVRVLVKAGDAVTARQPVVVVEAMKMENELRASRDGTVAEVHVREGQSVDAGALLARHSVNVFKRLRASPGSSATSASCLTIVVALLAAAIVDVGHRSISARRCAPGPRTPAPSTSSGRCTSARCRSTC